MFSIGMLMALFASFFGLMIAYVSYRKHTQRPVDLQRAKIFIWILIVLVVLALLITRNWGIIIPSLIFLVSFVVTWLLYKHFSTVQSE
jgi:hypothetical protein